MTHDCRLGFPAALAHTEPDDVRVRRTPPRTMCATGDAFANEDWTHVARHIVKGAAQGDAYVGFKPEAPSTSAAPVFKDGWIEWVGEKWERGDKIIGPPIDASTLVSVRFNDGTEDMAERAGFWNWGRFEFVGWRQIVAYRVR